MSTDEHLPSPPAHAKRVPLLSNGLPEVFMPDWIMRGQANVRVVPSAGDIPDQDPTPK